MEQEWYKQWWAIIGFIFIVLLVVSVVTERVYMSIKSMSTPVEGGINPKLLEQLEELKIPKKVTRVIDGDTIEIETGEKFRLICIDIPEEGEYYYEEAKEYLETIILNTNVTSITHNSETDRDGLLLRYVFLSSVFINELLVEKGYAKYYPHKPDSTFCQKIQEAENKAKKNRLGIWQDYEDNITTEESEEDESKIVAVLENSATCSCNSNSLTCAAFLTHDEAQNCYDYCKLLGKGDINNLDEDLNGVACESLP